MSNNSTIENMNNQIRCVSHEVRNHLSICEMYSQIIKKNIEKLDIENESIDNAINCIQKSIQIINSTMLDLKSLNNSTVKLFDFEKTILKGAELSRAYISDKEINFEVFVKNTGLINIDENKFLASFVNIVKNEIEAIKTVGTIEIIAEVQNSTGIIKISNNGEPIPKEKQKQIFKEGYTTKKTGSGLGLSICKKYLAEFDADIELTSSTKAKTTFMIKIPVSQ